MASEQTFQPDWVSAPGETIADLLQERGLPPAVFAQRIGYAPEDVNELLHGRALLTAETARLLEAHLGASIRFWLNRESQYRFDLARLHKDVQTDREWLKQFPLRDMIRFGWVPGATDLSEQVAACLEFFSVPDKPTWASTYGVPLELAAFRTSATFDSHPGAVAAWLRQGELAGRSISCKMWDSDRFFGALATIRPLTRQKDPTRFIPELTQICADCGVAVVVLRAPAGCRASGATRFVSPDRALLLLSLRYLSDDHFWFTFFHEAAHLLLHGPNALFLEAPEMLNSEQEQEANDFAARVLIPETFRSELDRLPLRHEDLIRFARRVGVSPGIIAGQLQHQGRLRRDQMNRLKRRFEWSDS
jgi:plasmid maintenance system antidote protein VapI/Zn-dependent peptidase ImmA (M78 family)